MYVIVRTMKVQKGFQEEMTERFLKPGAIQKSPGFIRSEMLFDKKHPEYDVYRQYIFWKDKKAFYVWEGSPEHIAMHRNKDSEHNKKFEAIIEVTRESYDLIASKGNE